MSMALIDLTKKLVLSQISAEEFEVQFFRLWKIEGAAGLLAKDSKEISECLYVVFDLAERYTSHPDRKAYELDSESLKKEAKLALGNFKFL